MDFEALRRENLAQKQKLLRELNLSSDLSGKPHGRTRRSERSSAIVDSGIKDESADDAPSRPLKKRTLAFENIPSRTSARIASSATRPSYKEDGGERFSYVEPKSTMRKNGVKKQRGTSPLSALPETKPEPALITADDAEDIRAKWNQWTPTGLAPTRDEDGTLHFDDYPDFTPNKSPEEVLREGCFGGSYFRPLKSRRLGITIADDYMELPSTWYDGLDIDRYLISPEYNADANKFGVTCGQSIEEWEANGWIAYEYDIRGWFQWYCRFFQGRRCDDDDRQVSRWKKCVGETGRWRRMLLKKYLQLGVSEVNDDGEDEDAPEVSPVMHQTCHHWAYEVRQGDLDTAWSGR